MERTVRNTPPPGSVKTGTASSANGIPICQRRATRFPHRGDDLTLSTLQVSSLHIDLFRGICEQKLERGEPVRGGENFGLSNRLFLGKRTVEG